MTQRITHDQAARRIGENIVWLLLLKVGYADQRVALVDSAPISHLIADTRAVAELADLDPDAAERAARAVL